MIVDWLRQALMDREAQLGHIAAEDQNAAINQGNRIEMRVNLLAEYPEMGRPGRMRGTRELVVNRTPFIVVYRVRPRAGRVEILRILHGAQQWPPRG